MRSVAQFLRNPLGVTIAALAAALIVAACVETIRPGVVASITVTPQQVGLTVGGRQQLTATALNSEGQTVENVAIEWSTSNEPVASVSPTGEVEARAAGAATITARSGLLSATASVTVTTTAPPPPPPPPPPAPVASVSVSPASVTVERGRTAQLTATVRDASGNVLTGRTITWASNNTAAATVSGTGLVSGVAAGSASVSATSEGKSNSASVTVTEPAPPPPPPPPGSSVVLLAAGDIANCGRDGDEKTAALLDTLPGIVITLGDNAYPYGTLQNYMDCYHPSWGRHKARTRPAPGNHEYDDGTNGVGYFAYFGAAAGDPAKGYYSYQAGDWHVIALNSEVDHSSSSAQVAWIKAELAAHPNKCTLAYFHKPRFTSGSREISFGMQDFWDALYAGNADVILSAHDHLYERFAPQRPDGAADPARGIRQFTVGTGGSGLYTFASTPRPNSEIRDNTSYGVLKLTLRDGGYDWKFVPVAGSTFTDSGSGTCH